MALETTSPPPIPLENPVIWNQCQKLQTIFSFKSDQYFKYFASISGPAWEQNCSDENESILANCSTEVEAGRRSLETGHSGGFRPHFKFACTQFYAPSTCTFSWVQVFHGAHLWEGIWRLSLIAVPPHWKEAPQDQASVEVSLIWSSFAILTLWMMQT